MKALDITGEKYGRLTAVRFERIVEKKRLWLFRCDCGNEIVRHISQIRAGGTTSCGCYQADVMRRIRTTHGEAKHPLYKLWVAMRRRCRNPNDPKFHRYGGRGIKICERWDSFANFLADMGPTYQPGLTLDRQNNDGDYTPENCRWATAVQQSRNRSITRIVRTPLGEMPVGLAEDISGIQRDTLIWRHQRGWPTEEMFRPVSPLPREVTESLPYVK